MKPSQTVMYGTETCPDCRRARMFLDSNRIEYKYIGVEEDPAAAEFVRQVNRGVRSVPTIIFPDGSVMVEPSWEELEIRFKVP
jgi:mycoredoxin